jgi:hypothetical protein
MSQGEEEEMTEVLVVANRTLGGLRLLERVRERAAAGGGDVHFHLVVPAQKPTSGLVVYDEAVRDAAQVRVDLALSTLAQEGITGSGEVGDPDVFQATLDAVGERRPDEIIISTYPAPSSGWLRRDLIERVHNATGLPVDHIVIDVATEGFPFKSTLVVANKTSRGEELIERLKEKASHGERHLFILIMPQPHGEGHGAGQARERLQGVLTTLRANGLLAAGMIGDPDPYTATLNGLELFSVDDVVISTLPAERSGWMRSQLVERARSHTNVPVEHVVVDLQPAPQEASV